MPCAGAIYLLQQKRRRLEEARKDCLVSRDSLRRSQGSDITRGALALLSAYETAMPQGRSNFYTIAKKRALRCRCSVLKLLLAASCLGSVALDAQAR